MNDELRTLPLARLSDGPREEGPPAEASHLLIVAHPEDASVGRKIVLEAGRTRTIGRSESADIAFPGIDSMSRVHAEVEINVAGVAIRDRGSTNGVLVNGTRLSETVYLKDGDRVELGEVVLKLVLDAATQQAETLYRLVNTDELTGAFNRRRFQEVLAAECIRADRYERPLALILFDVDEFKTINDSRGHAVGDEVLRGIVEIASKLARKSDLVARIGGDEFAIVCPEVSADQAGQFAERLRGAIAEELRPDGEITVSCSFGVAELGEKASTTESLQVAADRALYRSKERGRNAVSVG